jgi:hydrogenase maturation protease
VTRLVIGLGNPDRGDDAVGVDVAHRVRALAPDDVEVVVTDDPASLLDLWAGADDVVVVDAVVSHREPGAVVRVDVTSTGLPGHGWASAGSHALGLGAAVELSRALGSLPRSLVLVGVEAGATAPGHGLSPAVSAAVDTAARAALVGTEGGAR